ncbi:MAG: hypothetical protein N2Z22_07990 [Turneriella sp.]|nr:hypothetical protein [Turneriella sp.]
MLRYLLLGSLALVLSACEPVACYREWKARHLERRYGTRPPDAQTLAAWEREIAEYEKILNEKIDAGIKTGKLYRKLGESYALLESYELCIRNLEKAMEYGETVAEVFFWQGLCYANLSRVHNWQPDLAQKAEQSFLKALALDPTFNKAKYELAVMYYAAFSRNNRYRVLNEVLTVTQEQYHQKAIELMQEFKTVEPDQAKAYFFLAALYKERGEFGEARRELQQLMDFVRKHHPSSYPNHPDYRRAEQYLNDLEPKH